MIRFVTATFIIVFASTAIAADKASVEEGARIAVIGGCHDCHTEGFAENGGKVDPKKALLGNQVGFQGSWGTTYPANLRITLSKMSENEFVKYGHTMKARPPMPWYGVNAMTDHELRSLYQYVKSLGEIGRPAPEYVEPNQTSKRPFIVFAPPNMPAH